MKEIFIGVSDFQKFQQNDSYYVDKSLFIREMIDLRSEVLLIPRPRRFGKTLNLSMLRYYFERSEASRQGLFTDLAIWQQGEKYTKLQGTMPVIFVSFKDAKGATWDDVYQKMKDVIVHEYDRHRDVIQPVLNEMEKIKFQGIWMQTGTKHHYENSLLYLSQWLERAYGTQRVLLLIDEYDTPIHQAYAHGYYNECIGFMRGLLGSALKDNKSLERAVLTGILRVAKESIFSGLNNVRVCSILSPAFERSFGLLDKEVATALRDFGRVDEMDEFRRWYNGYVFGRETVYNPWSIFHALAEPYTPLQPYWVHTGDTALIEQAMDASRHDMMKDLTLLMQGEGIRKDINEHISFGDLDNNHVASLWSFLVFSGYLKVGEVAHDSGLTKKATLYMPNKEVSYVFEHIVRRWVVRPTQTATQDPMLQGLLTGDNDAFAEGFETYVAETFSYFDVHTGGAKKDGRNENLYHMFVLGMMIQLRDTHEVISNRESGKGRYDMALIPRNVHTHPRGFVFEFKEVEKETQLEKGVAQALRQMSNKTYDRELTRRKVPHIVHVGIAFFGKQTAVGIENRT